MSGRLVVVQTRPTQFDEPLYQYVKTQSDLDLRVIYTARTGRNNLIDPEIGRAPNWDHLGGSAESRRLPERDLAAGVGRLAAEIAGTKPGLVILCGYFPPVHAKVAWLLKRKGIAIGLRSDNILAHSSFGGVKGAIKRAVLPYWLRTYDTWHPVGTLAREYLERVANTQRPTFLFPYNVDNAWLAREADKYRRCRDQLRRDLRIGETEFVVLGIAKLHPREDPLMLIDAFAKLRKNTRGARLVLVGDGPLRAEVEERARLLGDAVYLPGYQPYSCLPKYFAISDLFVHPAVNEPWGVSVNEAMACGLPVAAAESVGAGVDLITKGETGFVFPAGDSGALSELILRLTQDRTQCARMGTVARQRISAWSYETTLQEMHRALDLVATAKGHVST